jgi:hypothetical protein
MRRPFGPRGLLPLDSALCAATGALAFAAAPAVADGLGPDVPTTAVRVTGLALLVWAVDVALLTRARGRLLRRAAVAVAVAAVVGGLGLLQLRAARG